MRTVEQRLVAALRARERIWRQRKIHPMAQAYKRAQAIVREEFKKEREIEAGWR